MSQHCGGDSTTATPCKNPTNDSTLLINNIFGNLLDEDEWAAPRQMNLGNSAIAAANRLKAIRWHLTIEPVVNSTLRATWRGAVPLTMSDHDRALVIHR